MNKNLTRLFVYIMIVCFPFCSKYIFIYIAQEKIEYVNVIPEICLLNIVICAYTVVTFLSTDLIKNAMCRMCYLVSILSIMIAMIMYIQFSRNTDNYIFLNDWNEAYMSTFRMLIIFTVINVILAAFVQIYLPESKGKNHYYENKYENYLLNKIDSKQESNKNQTEESNEKQKEEVKSNKVDRDSEPDINILAEMLKNENEISEYFKVSEPDTDIFAEMLKNYNETREYFKISKFQSKFSFFVSVFAAIAGFIILGVAIYGIINNEHLEVSIIAAVSGAITEIASVVVLGIHNKSALQLNYYYDALHENEKLLSAINMADKLNADKREEMYMEIIRKQIDIQPKKRG